MDDDYVRLTRLYVTRIERRDFSILSTDYTD